MSAGKWFDLICLTICHNDFFNQMQSVGGLTAVPEHFPQIWKPKKTFKAHSGFGFMHRVINVKWGSNQGHSEAKCERMNDNLCVFRWTKLD